MHGDFLKEKVGEKNVGGINMLSGYIHKTRKEEKNVIYAIAGDMFRGSIIDSEFKGISTIELVNFLAPDVVTLGNHEVDYGIAHLLFLEKCAKFPIINSNLFIKSNHQRLFKPYEIIERDGIRIMFIGILTEEVLAQTKGEGLVGSFIDIWEAAKEVGVIIDNYKTTSVDYTVLLTHIGFEEDKKLAEILNPDWGIDLIIGGHSHTLLNEPCVVNDIPIVQVGTGTDQIGRFDLEFDDEKKLSSFKWECVPIDEDTCKEDRVMNELLSTYKSQTDKKYQRIITKFAKPFTHPHRNMETELGNFVADLLQEDSSFDIMLMPSGSIRKVSMGPLITYQDLTECLPYDGPVSMYEATGKQFKHMMKFMLRDDAMEDKHTEFYQVSKGMHMVYDFNTKEFVEFKFNGNELKDDDRIKFALLEGFHTNSFKDFFDVELNEIEKNMKPRRVMTSYFSIFEELLSLGTEFNSNLEDRIVVLNRPEQ